MECARSARRSSWWDLERSASARPAAQRPSRQEEQDPLALFSAMMPVFSSPRCVNCHGGVLPATGENHQGGKVDVAFDSTAIWKTARPRRSPALNVIRGRQVAAPRREPWFVGKDAAAMCRQLKSVNDLRDTNQEAKDIIFHLSEDYFVGLAFVGQRAIGDDSPFGPLERPATHESGRLCRRRAERLTAGHALCGLGWSGTIMVTKTAAHHEITQGNTVERDSALRSRTPSRWKRARPPRRAPGPARLSGLGAEEPRLRDQPLDLDRRRHGACQRSDFSQSRRRRDRVEQSPAVLQRAGGTGTCTPT